MKRLSSLAALLDEFSTAEQKLHESQYLWFLANKDATAQTTDVSVETDRKQILSQDPAKRPKTNVLQDAEARPRAELSCLLNGLRVIL